LGRKANVAGAYERGVTVQMGMANCHLYGYNIQTSDFCQGLGDAKRPAGANSVGQASQPNLGSVFWSLVRGFGRFEFDFRFLSSRPKTSDFFLGGGRY
jgi:hypothetical protein